MGVQTSSILNFTGLFNVNVVCDPLRFCGVSVRAVRAVVVMVVGQRTLMKMRMRPEEGKYVVPGANDMKTCYVDTSTCMVCSHISRVECCLHGPPTVFRLYKIIMGL